jgi:FMN-dependent NADH-azoreductase
MPTLLNVQSSPNAHSSGSRAVSKAFVDAFVAAHPGTTVVDLDLSANPPTHIGPDHLRAFFTPPETHEPANTAASDVSNAYVAQLLAADVIVLGTPMHNFGVSSTMKSWIDNILRIGLTFKYTETGGVGLVPPGKKLVIVVGSGGIYSQGPYAAYEHAGNYLRDIMAFIGITDSTILRAEGLTLGPEMMAKGLAEGKAAAIALAAQ